MVPRSSSLIMPVVATTSPRLAIALEIMLPAPKTVPASIGVFIELKRLKVQMGTMRFDIRTARRSLSTLSAIWKDSRP